MKNDYLPFIEKEYLQSEEGYHFNTDTVLLGLFLPHLRGKSVLDIGTQAGALLLYAKEKGAKELWGIDVNTEALTFAQKNLPEGKFQAVGLADFVHTEFDVILCNPPFYPDKKREKIALHYALNSSCMPLDLLFRKVRSLLKSNGSFYMIYPAGKLNELLSTAGENDFSALRIRFVYDANKEQALRVLCCFKRGRKGESKILPPFKIVEGKIKEPRL